MNQKKSVLLAILTLSMLSGLFLTACNFPIAKDDDDLPLEEWEVSSVKYHPNFWAPYVDVLFSNKTSGTGYRKEGATDGWLSKLLSIPGLELGDCDFISGGMEWSVKNQTAAAGEPLTAYFSHEEFIRVEGDGWDRNEVARVRIKTDSMPVTIIK